MKTWLTTATRCRVICITYTAVRPSVGRSVVKGVPGGSSAVAWPDTTRRLTRRLASLLSATIHAQTGRQRAVTRQVHKQDTEGRKNPSIGLLRLCCCSWSPSSGGRILCQFDPRIYLVSFINGQVYRPTPRILKINEIPLKMEKKRSGTCYNAGYITISLKRHQKRFTISEVAVNWHELTMPQHTMRPSIARVSKQLDPEQPANIPPPHSAARLCLYSVFCKLLVISRPVEDKKLNCSEHMHCTVNYKPVDSHRGAQKNILVEPPNISRGPSGKKLNFSLQMVHSGILYIFGRRRSPQTSRGPGVRGSLLPLTSPS